MRKTMSEFRQAFPTPPLHHREPESDFTPWVFWSEYEKSSSPSAIHEKLIYSFAKMNRVAGYICQFWAPVTTIDDRRLLSTSGYPFAVGYLSTEFAMYRQYSEHHKYDIDVDNHIGDAFLNCLSSVNYLHWIPSEVDDIGLHVSITLPICLAFFSPRTCIGVFECAADANLVADVVLDVIANLKEAGLDVFPVQDLIPYKTINRLKLVKDEIDDALKVVCRLHNLALAQVWIPYEDKALKLTGYVFDVTNHGYTVIHTLCDSFPSMLALSTLQDHASRFVSRLCTDFLLGLDGAFLPESKAATICLKSSDTGDIDYAFEFVCTKDIDFPASLLGVVSTLKECLPRFKFASGGELHDSFFVSYVGKTTSKAYISQRIRLVPRKRSSPMPEEAEENLHSSSEISRKRIKVNDSSINTNENVNGAIQDPSTDNLPEYTLSFITLEADYRYGILKFHLHPSQATFANVEKEIFKQLGLSARAYDLQYLDEEDDWICMDTEEEMGNCVISSIIRASAEEEMGDSIRSLRIQLRVLLSQKSVTGPFKICSI